MAQAASDITFESLLNDLRNTKDRIIDLTKDTIPTLLRKYVKLSILELIEAKVLPADIINKLRSSKKFSEPKTGLRLIVYALNNNPHHRIKVKLDLCKCRLEDADLKDLGKLKKYLIYLNLSENDFTLRGCADLITGLLDPETKKATFGFIDLRNPSSPFLIGGYIPLTAFAEFTQNPFNHYYLECEYVKSPSPGGVSLVMANIGSSEVVAPARTPSQINRYTCPTIRITHTQAEDGDCTYILYNGKRVVEEAPIPIGSTAIEDKAECCLAM